MNGTPNTVTAGQKLIEFLDQKLRIYRNSHQDTDHKLGNLGLFASSNTTIEGFDAIVQENSAYLQERGIGNTDRSTIVAFLKKWIDDEANELQIGDKQVFVDRQNNNSLSRSGIRTQEGPSYKIVSSHYNFSSRISGSIHPDVLYLFEHYGLMGSRDSELRKNMREYFLAEYSSPGHGVFGKGYDYKTLSTQSELAKILVH